MWFEVFVADPLSDEVPDPVGGRLTITREKLSLKPNDGCSGISLFKVALHR